MRFLVTLLTVNHLKNYLSISGMAPVVPLVMCYCSSDFGLLKGDFVVRITSLKLSILALVVVAALAMAPAASASSITTLTQGAYTATLTVGTGTATLTLSGPTTGFFVNAIAIQLGGNTITVTGGTASLGSWTFQNGQNSVQCSGTGNWGCAISSTAQTGNGLTLTFNFSGTPSSGAGTTYSVQFDVCSTSATALNNQGNEGCVKGRGGNFVTNFSQSGTPVTSTVPEPGTLGLLGTGLVGIAGLVRRDRI